MKMRNFLGYWGVAACVLLMTGCSARVEYVDTMNDSSRAVVGLDYRDFERAATEATASLIQSGAMDNPNGGRYVLMISSIVNDTMQRIDTDQLVKKMRVELLRSGKAVVTTAVGAGGAEDKANFQVREGLRGNKEFDQKGVQREGTLQAPDMSLSGKIIQRNIPDGRRQRIEYYFQLTMTELSSGLAWWEGETIIAKSASGRTVAW